MEHNRILELAIAELERQKAAISAEIETIRSQLKGSASRPAKKAKAASAHTGRISRKTAAARKAQSLRMKEYWAAKRAETAKSTALKKTPPASGKARPKTEAEKKALSLKMKEVWKRRRAEAAKKKQ